MHLRRVAGAHVLRELRRNLQPGVSAAFANCARHRIDALDFADHAKGLSVDEAIDKLATFRRAILIEDDQRHMLHVGIESVAERDHLHQRREKHEEQRHRIAPDDDEFLEQNCAESAERFAFHTVCSVIPSGARDLAYAERACLKDRPISGSVFQPTRFSYCAASL